MFRQLDDPLPLAAASRAQREAVIRRGTALRRRRRSFAAAASLGVAAFVTAVVVTGTGLVSNPPTRGSTVAPAAPPDQSVLAPAPQSPPAAPPESSAPSTFMPAYSACSDAVGDSLGSVDLAAVAIDRPTSPFIHFHWDGSRLPPVGTVEAILEATSADGERSRQLVLVIVDEIATGQFVLDPATGDREDADAAQLQALRAGQAADNNAETALGGSFPGSAVMPLGDGWTWTASLTVDGTVVDSLDGIGCS